MSSSAVTHEGDAAAQIQRCAIYTRTALAGPRAVGRISYEKQRHICQGYVEAQVGWVLLAEPYDDRGFSGANLDRPALQRLLAQIDARSVDVVVVQRADVLSRWYLDFVSLMERMRAHDVHFVAVSDSFSTAGLGGRNLLRLVLSFAELQRAVMPPVHTGIVVAGRRGW